MVFRQKAPLQAAIRWPVNKASVFTPFNHSVSFLPRYHKEKIKRKHGADGTVFSFLF